MVKLPLQDVSDNYSIHATETRGSPRQQLTLDMIQFGNDFVNGRKQNTKKNPHPK